MEKLALCHRLKIQSDCNRRWLLGTSRQMMDDFLLKWQLCCVSAILKQHKCTGRLLWLFNSYHCGKWISNVWQAISGWQGTFGSFLSFSFSPLSWTFFPFFANVTKDAHWSFQPFTSGSWGTKSRTTRSLLQQTPHSNPVGALLRQQSKRSRASWQPLLFTVPPILE